MEWEVGIFVKAKRELWGNSGEVKRKLMDCSGFDMVEVRTRWKWKT